jgi:hypothetical protein
VLGGRESATEYKVSCSLGTNKYVFDLHGVGNH